MGEITTKNEARGGSHGCFNTWMTIMFRVAILGGGFKYFLFSPRLFFKGVEITNYVVFLIINILVFVF